VTESKASVWKKKKLRRPGPSSSGTMDDDDDFDALFDDFNMMDDDDDIEESALIHSISANLREAAGLTEASAPTTTWTAPETAGLHNSGLAADELKASATRRAEEELWQELSPSGQRRLSTVGRRNSGEDHVTTSDNLLADLELIDDAVGRAAEVMTKEEAGKVAAGLDMLAAHARTETRLNEETLRTALNDVRMVEEGSNLLQLLRAHKHGDQRGTEPQGYGSPTSVLSPAIESPPVLRRNPNATYSSEYA